MTGCRVLVFASAIAMAGCSLLVGDDDSSSGIEGSTCGDAAIQFDGIDDLLVVPSNSVFNSDDFTAAVWVRPQRLENFTSFVSNRGDDLGWELDHGSDGPGARVFVDSDPPQCAVVGNDPLPIGQWSHVALSFFDQTARLFVNGTIVATMPCSGAYRANDRDLSLGTSLVSGNRFEGDMDDFVFCSPAVATSFDPFTTPPCTAADATLIANFSFEEGVGDSSAAANDASLEAMFGTTDRMDDQDPTWILEDECE